MRRSIATGFVSCLLLCSQAQAGDIADLGWLSGCWHMERDGQVIEEIWMAPSGGVALGVGRTLSRGELLNYEYMRIEAVDGVPVFYAAPKGQTPADFPAIHQTADEIVFENTKHDFPQKVVYRRTDTGLHAHISGPVDGQSLTINFDYQRCQP